MKKFYSGVIGTAVLAVCALVTPAGATARSSGVTGTATTAASTAAAPLAAGYAYYNGNVINLASGWDGAKACLVPSDQAAQCYATLAAAKAAANAITSQELATVAAAEASAQVRGNARRISAALAKSLSKGALRGGRDDGPCNGDGSQWLWLYSGTNYSGSSIGFQGSDNWYELADYGWAGVTASYINETACDILWLDNNNDYYWSAPWYYTGNVGSWRGYLDYVYIEQN